MHSSEAYFPLLSSLSRVTSLNSLSQASLVDATLPLLADLLHPATIPAWHLGLAAKETAPVVEALISVHDEQVDDELASCGAWIDWAGQRGCGVDGAVRVLGLDQAKGDIAWDSKRRSVR